MNEEEIQKLLKAYPGSRRTASGVCIGDETASFYITGFGQRDDDLTDGEQFFAAFCSKKEIIRLRELKSAHDYLLRFRANAIVDSPRLVRVMSARREKFESGKRSWTLSDYYSTLNSVPKKYIQRLNRKERKIVKSVPYGFAPLAEANALCLKSLVGEVIIVSEALRHFYYFMTICLHGERYGIELADRADAGLIGLRIMVGSEAQDFDIDPRGVLPPRTEAAIRQHVDSMIEFTFGHEYGHLLCNHLPSDEQTAVSLHNAELRTYQHNQEYEADLHPLRMVSGDRSAQGIMARAAYNVFLYLHLIELLTCECSDIPSLSVSETHPAPLDRLRKLREMLGDRDQPTRHRIGFAIRAVRQMRDILLDRMRVSHRDDVLTFYGSIYMHGLGGKERRDRIDY